MSKSNCVEAIERSNQVVFTPTILSGTALSTPINFCDFVMMQIHIPAVWTAAEIGYYVSPTVDGTYVPLFDETGAIIENVTIVVDTAVVSPPRIAGARFVRIWSQSSGIDVNQGADRVLIVVMKA